MNTDDLAREYGERMLKSWIKDNQEQYDRKAAGMSPDELTALKAKFIADHTACGLKAIQWVLDRDLHRLRSIVSIHNKNWRWLFERITGRKLPPTQSASIAMLRDWYGQKLFDEVISKENDAKRAEENARQAERDERARQSVLGERYNFRLTGESARPHTFKEIIDRLFNCGITRIEYTKRGAFPIVRLNFTNPNGGASSVTFRKAGQIAYVKEREAQLQVA